MYAQDYDEKFMSYGTTYDLWGQSIAPYIKNIQIFVCPTTDVPSAPAWGSARTGWRWSATHAGSYAFNGNFYYGYPYSYSLASVQQPSDTYLFGDAMWIDTWPDPVAEPYPPPPPWTPDAGLSSSSMGRIALDRHNGGVNNAFIDGHAKWSKYENLWNLWYHGERP
jgi:prepilin-type processing-associated H-X9-DG protein